MVKILLISIQDGESNVWEIKDYAQKYKNNAILVAIRKPVFACISDCPADNQARQIAQFLYGTS
ncbi:hypothetical protein DET49_13231 [Salegentibacter sp. 24]|nr:hypothetical protein DET49_13231 [Salegentibacter sp. 24]